MASEENEAALEDMTKSELQDKADELGVDYSDSDTKAELIDAINAAEEPEEGEDESAEEDGAPVGAFPGGPFPSEENPERIPIEVDVADVEPAEYEGEITPPLNAESWVVLDGDHDEVPDEYDGAIAAVIESPSVTETNPDTGEKKTYFPLEGLVTVRERSQGALLSLPMEAFKEVHTHGRPTTFA